MEVKIFRKNFHHNELKLLLTEIIYYDCRFSGPFSIVVCNSFPLFTGYQTKIRLVQSNLKYLMVK